MNKAIGGFVVCVLGLVACNVEHYDDCMGDSFDYGDDVGGGTGHGHAGSTSTSGKASGESGATGSGAASSAATGGTASGGASSSVGGTNSSATPQPCDEESDCNPGFNCDLEQQQCVASDEETCGELKTEAACTHRSDCTPVYAGINCSCGQDCECKGGEPGCVCESFEFFVCQAAG